MLQSSQRMEPPGIPGRFSADIDSRAAKTARQKDRDGHIGTHAEGARAARHRDDVTRKPDFGDIEFLVIPSPVEALLGWHGDEIDVATFHSHTAVHERPY